MDEFERLKQQKDELEALRERDAAVGRFLRLNDPDLYARAWASASDMEESHENAG